MSKFKRLEEKEFDTIKIMLGAGIKPHVIVAATRRAPSTIAAIRTSATLGDYRTKVQKYYMKPKASEEQNHVSASTKEQILQKIDEARKLIEASNITLQNES